jgi:DeoR/GlpR family transcriptional regulator of sugar metabolism
MMLHVSKSADEAASLPADRQRHILDRLSKDGQVNASLLAMEFSTSEDTIRRDLRNLAAQGLCQRVYGGAVLISPASACIAIRANESNARKEALGRTLATLLQPRQFLFIDAGSTNLAFARMIPVGLQLTIATHDPSIAACLVGKPDVELIVVGGSIHPEIGAALGGRAMQEIAGMRPGLLVLGACSFHVDHGVGAFNFEDAQIKNVLIQNAGSVALALLNEKLVPLPRRSFHGSTRSLTSLLRLMLRCLRRTPLCKKDYGSIGPTQQSATAQRFERTLNKEKYERD